MPTPGSPAVPGRLEAIERRFPRFRAMLVLGIVVVTLNIAHVRGVTAISPYDELFHIDYLHQVVDGRIRLQADTQLTPETLRDVACRGHQQFPYPPELCAAPRLHARQFTWEGVNLSASHNPAYYVATGWPAEVLRAITPFDIELSTWGRLLSSVWLLLGVYVALRAGELLGIRRWAIVPALVVLAASPPVLHALGSVNPDNTAILSGAALLLVVVAWEQRKAPLWAVPLVALAASALDSQNNLAALLVGCYLAVGLVLALLGRSGEHRRDWTGYLWCGALVVLGAWLAQRGWSQLQLWNARVTRTLDYTTAPNYAPFVVEGGFPYREVFKPAQTFAFMPPYADAFKAPKLDRVGYEIFQYAAGIVAIAGVVLALIRVRLGRILGTLTVVTTIVLLAGPTLLNVYNYRTGGTIDTVLPRFGMSLMPALFLVVASAATNRITRGVLWLAAAGLYLAAMLSLV